MPPALTVLTVLAYLLAIALLWFDRSLRPLLLLVAGSLATLSQPLWARLFGTSLELSGSMLRIGSSYALPNATLLGGGVLLALPPLFIIYGLRHRWWSRHYAACWGFFVIFLLFFVIMESLNLRADALIFARPTMSRYERLGLLLHFMLLSGISFGLLYAFVATRHYALRIALGPLLLSGLLAGFLFNGILASPYWAMRYLGASGASVLPQRFQVAGIVIAIALIIWSIHLLASGMHAGRRQQLQWR